MPIRPLHDRVLVRRAETETLTKGGLHVPGNAQENKSEGVVVAAGDGRVLETGAVLPLAVKVGERIIFRKYADTELVVEGEKLVLVAESDILAVVDVA